MNTVSHPTAAWIYQRTKDIIPSISLGTIYRNLGLLVQNGDIQELNIDHGQSRYDAKNVPHYHFRCYLCGDIYDLDIAVDDSMNKTVQIQTGFKVSGHRVTFFGICRRCNRTKKSKKGGEIYG